MRIFSKEPLYLQFLETYHNQSRRVIKFDNLAQ